MIARPLLLANVLAVTAYISWQGAQRFWWEAFGTWMMSPVIYARLCPEPLKHWFMHTSYFWPSANFLLCMVPVAMLLLSLGLGILAWHRNSARTAVVSCLLMTTVFAFYHSVKHMGMQFVVD